MRIATSSTFFTNTFLISLIDIQGNSHQNTDAFMNVLCTGQKFKKRWVTRMLASFLWRKPAKKAHPVAGHASPIFCPVLR